MRDKNPSWRRYFRFLGVDPEKELREEFRFHLETEVEALIAEGVPEREARERALARFGDVESAAAECRAADARRLRRQRRAHLLDRMRQDAGYALRGLVNRPAFTCTVVITLAIGVGANAAIFTVVDRVFLRSPAGVQEPEALRRLYTLDTRRARVEAEVSVPEARDIQRGLGSDFPLAIHRREPNTPIHLAPDVRRVVGAAWVSPNFLRVLGLRPALGRGLADDDDLPGQPSAAAIVSWTFWRNELGGQGSAIGRTIRVNGQPATIVGIAPRGFTGIELGSTHVWLPLGSYRGVLDGAPDWQESRGWSIWQTIVRIPSELTAGQLTERAQVALRHGYEAYRTANPRREQFGDPSARVLVGSIIAARGPGELSHEMAIVLVLTGLAAIVFIIACANATNLMLGRALQRRRESALRVALGIRPARLLGQVVLEAAMIAAAAGFAAMLVASWVGGALRRMLLPDVNWPDVPLDLRVAIFAMAIALIGAVAAGLVAARETLRADPGAALKGDARDGGGRRSRLRAGLVGVQAALSLVLVVGTGLLARSLYNVRGIDIGYDTSGLISVLPEDSVALARLPVVAELARTLPGVTAVATAFRGPFNCPWVGALFKYDGSPVAYDSGCYQAAEADYLATAGIRIVQGRALSPADRLGAEPVMVMSEAAARLLWPGRRAVGECLRIHSAGAPCYRVVGVAENTRSFLFREHIPFFYFTLEQRPRRPVTAGAMLLRVDGDPGPVLERLRLAIGDTLPWISPRPVELVAETLAPQYRPWQLGARLFAGFAMLAVILAGLGLYSVLAYIVTLRRHELGVRLALGAQQRQVVRMLIGDGVRHVAGGALAGLLIVVIGAPRLSPLLYEVGPRDPMLISAGILALLLGTAIAALLPARRAARVDPMIALRSE